MDTGEAFLSRLFWAHYCVIICPPALYLGLLIVGLSLGRAEVGSPSIELRALTLARLFDVFLWRKPAMRRLLGSTPSPVRHSSLSHSFWDFLLLISPLFL